MSGILRTIWLMLALVYSAGAVLAQEPPDQKEQVWVVRHETEAGLKVPGFAVYDPKAGTLTLNYKPDKTPYDGQDFGSPYTAPDYYQVLVTKEITIDKDRLTAVFRGKNVNPVFDGFDLGPEVPDEDLVFEIGGKEKIDRIYEEHARLLEKTAAFEISLNRKFDDVRTLEGGWTYSADIFTKPFTGKEKWTRAGKIVDIIVLQDQRARNDLGRAAFPYPFGDDPEAKYRNKTTRKLFVVGTNLPNKGGQVFKIDSLDRALRYRIDAVQNDADEYSTVAADFKKGWAKFTERAGRPQGDLDGIIVIAKLKDGVVAGPKGLVLNGSRGTWTLGFGDATGEMSFTRDRAVKKVTEVPKRVWNKSRNRWAATKLTEKRVETTEKTTLAYLYDEITVQIELENSFPIDQFEVTLGPPATVQIDLKRAIGPASAASPIVVLKKSPENARLYRSEPLYIVERNDDGQDRPKGPEGIILRVNTPGKLVAKLDDPRIFLVPPFSILELEGTPDEVGGSFIQALRQASNCYGNAPVVDWRKLSNRKAKDISNVIITELGSRSIRLTFGDHAAMLLMRQEFLRQMAQARNTYANMVGNAALLVVFARTIDPVQFGDDSPIARMQVPNPENLNTTMSFGDFVLYNDDIKPRFMVRPTRIAIQNFIKAIDASIARAKSIGNCDTDGLLQLTGHGFDVLVATLEPKLMRSRFNKELNRLEIEPDTLGRAWVRGLATTAAAVRTQREYSSVDTDFSVAIGAVILSGGASALFGEGLAGMAAALAVDVAASSITTPATWLEYLRSQKELEFALGASAVLGTDRLDTAELEAVDWYDAALATYLEVASIALGAAGDSIAAIKAARGGALTDMVERGEKLAASLAGDGARKLSVKEAADLGAFLSQAKNTALKSGTGALSDVQKRALAAVDEASSATRLVDDLPPSNALASSGNANGSLGDLSGGFGNGSGLPNSGDFGNLGPVDDMPGLNAVPSAPDAEDFTDTLSLNAPPRDAADLSEALDLAKPPRSVDDFTPTEILPAPPRADAEDFTATTGLANPPRSVEDFTPTEILPAPPRADAEDLAATAGLASPPKSTDDFTDTIGLPPPNQEDFTATTGLASPPRSVDDFTPTDILPAPPKADNFVKTAPPEDFSVAALAEDSIRTAPPVRGGAAADAVKPPRLEDGELGGFAIDLKEPGGGTVTDVAIGEPLGVGSYNDVYTVPGEPESVYRVSKVAADDPEVLLDDMGWDAFGDLDNSVVRTPEVRGTYTTDIGDISPRVRKLETFEQSAAKQLAANPPELDGAMTPQQAVAFDKATREMNAKGYVWLDNHTKNYAFEPAPGGTGELRVVVTDPGGIVKVKGDDPAGVARRIQKEINAPPPEFVRKVTAEGANVDILREVRRENILEEFGDRLTLPEGMNDPVSSFAFRTDQNAPFARVQDLFGLGTVEVQAAYGRLLAQ